VVCYRLGAGGSSEAAVLALQEQLHEKDMRLTDVQLEALSSAHQLQQMQDTINRMKVINEPHRRHSLYCLTSCSFFSTIVCTQMWLLWRHETPK